MTNKVKIDISTFTILKITLVLLGLWFLYLIRDIALLFFFVIVIVATLNPLVDRMAKYIPRLLAVLIIFAIFIGLVVLGGFLIFPPLVHQIGQLSINLPYLVNRFGLAYQNIQEIIPNYQDILLNISSQLGKLTTGIYTTTIGFLGGLVAFFTMLVLSFYLLMEKEPIRDFLTQIIPAERREVIFGVFKKISAKMGSWLRGQIILMVLIGLLDGLALLVLGVPYALTLAVWGGLTEIIPYIGPWLGLIPAVIVALTVSPLKALFVVIAYLLIQQIEAQFLAPKVMGKAVGLSPVIIILALLIGAKLFGILGILVAVPVAAVIWVLLQEWPELKKIRENS